MKFILKEHKSRENNVAILVRHTKSVLLMDAWHCQRAKYWSLTNKKKICMTETPTAVIKPWNAHKIVEDN